MKNNTTPYRPRMSFTKPKPAPQDEDDVDIFQPTKIFVKGLPPDMTEDALVTYFNNFGTVVSCVLKLKPPPLTGYAFVEFHENNAVTTVLRTRPHMVNRGMVSVHRAFKTALPSRPFPAMDVSWSFKQQCHLHDAMASSPLSRASHSTGDDFLPFSICI